MALFALLPMALGELFFDVIIRRDIPYGAVVWLAIILWNAYWFLFRFAHGVELDGAVLRWRAPLRSGSVALADIRRVRPSWLFSNIQVMETGARGPAMVWAVRGFRDLVEAVCLERPGLPCQLSPQARIAGRMPLRSGFLAGVD